MLKNCDYSFEKGFSQIQKKDLSIVKDLIMDTLNIKTNVSWYKRLYGHIEPRVSEMKKIESIFSDFEIKDIWGLVEK